MFRSAPILLLSMALPPSASAQAHRTHPATQAEPAVSSLPIRRVALYKNGVGFFEHVGQVHGSERVTIDFTTAQLNDVLQTLTAIDLGGGHVAGAGYNSTTPVEQQLRSLPLSLDANAEAVDFYAAIRGARVEVTGDGAPLSGRILNVEVREAPSSKDGEAPPMSRHFLTVISDTGTVRSVELTGRTGVRLLDASLHADVNRYLQILGENPKPCDVPERQERCRADAPFGDEAREGVEVVLFLGLHVAEDVAFRSAAEHGELALVDALGTVFAGMVHAHDALDLLARGDVAGQAARHCT